MKADVYEKIDKELLTFVEDVLLNRCENATERMMEFAASLDPKSKPTDLKRKGEAATVQAGKAQVNVQWICCSWGAFATLCLNTKNFRCDVAQAGLVAR